MADVHFEVGNGSVRLIDASTHGAGRTCTALLAAFLVAVPLNALVIIAVLRSFLRSHVFNLLLASLSAAAFLDGFINLSLASVFRGSWTDLYRLLGDSLIWMCRLSIASIQLPMSLQVSSLVLLSAHCLSGLSAGSQNLETSPVKKPRMKRYGWLLLLSWVSSVTTVLPIMFGVVDARFFDERSSCSPVNVTNHAASLATAVSLLTFGHGLPYLILFGLWTILLIRVLRERQRILAMELVALQRAAARSSPVRGMGSSSTGFSFSSTDQFWGDGDTAAGHGYRFFVLTGVLSGLQLLLVVPGLVSIATTEFSMPTQSTIYHHYYPDLANNSVHLPTELKPLHTPWFDGIFTWLRIIHTVAVPCLILAFHKPLRAQCRDLFGLNKSSQHATAQSASGYLTIQKQGRRKRKKSKFQQLFDENTPILFATTDGIHLRQLSESSAPHFTSVFADLWLKQAGENVPRLAQSPEKSHRVLKQDVRLFDEEDTSIKTRKAGGKCVRFSQRVNEIPEDISGSLGNVSTPATRIDVEPIKLLGPALSSSMSVMGSYNWEGRRSSEPVVNVRIPDQKSLEMDLANTSLASTSSGSLLLPFSQRMRNRNS